MLRQSPVECLFQFICSSNNHISRIGGMVERLCAAYGTPLVPSTTATTQALQHQQQQQQEEKASASGATLLEPATPAGASKGVGSQVPEPRPPPLARRGAARSQQASVEGAHTQPAGMEAANAGLQGHGAQGSPTSAAAVAHASEMGGVQGQRNRGVEAHKGDPLAGKRYYAFPTLQQLANAQEAELRALGFGWVTIMLGVCLCVCVFMCVYACVCVCMCVCVCQSMFSSIEGTLSAECWSSDPW